jgi:prevent-host-death family protein
MATIAAFEAKTRFGELLDRVVAGEEIVITRHEKPIARIVPEGGPRLEQSERAACGLEALQEEIAASASGKSRVSWKQFRTFVEEGRR